MFGPTQMASVRIFISYSNTDRDLVDPLRYALARAGAHVWMDHEQLAPGAPDWQNAIRQGIEQATYVIYVASPAAYTSAHIASELEIALDAKKPVRCFWARGEERSGSIPASLSSAPIFDARGAGYNAGLGKLLGALGLGAPGVTLPPADSPPITRESPPVPPPAPAAPPDSPGSPGPVTPAPSPWPQPPASPGYGPPPPGYGPPSGYGSPGGYNSPQAPQRRGGSGESATKQPPQPVSLERVAFASYYPKEIEPLKATPLLVYLAVDEVGALARLAALAAERLAGKLDQYRPEMADERLALRRGAKLRIAPSIPGFRVNPQWMDVTWDEDAQQHEFSIRAESAPEGRTAEGAVRVYQGLTLRAEIPLSIFVKRGASVSPTDFASAVARAYRKIFASYSHRDTPVVESCEAAARGMGDRYLRDVITLQSGQQWNSQLMTMITEADVFQLFWSKNAAGSPFVRQEWEYALTLQANRPGFIRPVYWSSPPYAIPPQLNALHFEPLNLSALGWGPLRRFLYGLQTG